MESAWSNGNPPTSAATAPPQPARPSGTPEERLCPRGPDHAAPGGLHQLLTKPASGPRRRRTRHGTGVRSQSAEDVTCYLREQEITLTYDPAAGTLHAGTGDAAHIITLQAS